MRQNQRSLSTLEMKLQIIELNHEEHSKFSIELQHELEPSHPKIIELENELGNMVNEINAIKKEIDTRTKEKKKPY